MEISGDLIKEIRAYLKETESTITALGREACSDPSIINQILYRGRSVSERISNKIRDTMKQHPHGIGTRRRVRDSAITFKSVPRTGGCTSCFYCGIRSDIGCSHFPKETTTA